MKLQLSIFEYLVTFIKKVANLWHFGTEHSVVYRITSHGTKSEDTAVKKLMFQ